MLFCGANRQALRISSKFIDNFLLLALIVPTNINGVSSLGKGLLGGRGWIRLVVDLCCLNLAVNSF